MSFCTRLLAAAATLVLGAATGAAQAVVVDLDATREGYTVSQTFAAGTYDVRWVGVAGGGAYDAWGASFDPLSPTGHSMYRDSFAVSFDGGAPLVFGDFGAYALDTAGHVLGVAQAHPVSFSFAAATTVRFAIPDMPGYFGDNVGGVSLSITQAVPEPQTYALLLAGLGAVAWLARRRRVDGR